MLIFTVFSSFCQKSNETTLIMTHFVGARMKRFLDSVMKFQYEFFPKPSQLSDWWKQKIFYSAYFCG